MLTAEHCQQTNIESRAGTEDEREGTEAKEKVEIGNLKTGRKAKET